MPPHQPFAKNNKLFQLLGKKWQGLLKVPWLPIED